MRNLYKLKKTLQKHAHKSMFPTFLKLEKGNDCYTLELDSDNPDKMEAMIPTFTGRSPKECVYKLNQWVKADKVWWDRFNYLARVCPAGPFIIVTEYEV